MRADIGIYFALVGIVLPVASTVKAFRSPSWRQMKRWATDAGVTITENNEDMIRQRLGRFPSVSVGGQPSLLVALLPPDLG